MKANSRRVIRATCLPTRSPIGTFVLYWLLLDRFNVPGWVWGVFGTFAVILIVSVLIAWHQEDEAEIPGFGRNQ